MNLSLCGCHLFRHALPAWLFALLGCWLALAGTARGAPSVGGVLVETQIEQVYGRSGVPLGDWSPDGRWYAQPGVANDIEVWDNWIGQLTRHITGHAGELKRVCFSPDGTQLITIAADNTLRRWDFAAGTELARIHMASTPLALDVNATGTLAVTAEASGAVNIWSLTSNTLLTTATTLTSVPTTSIVRGIKFSPGSKLVFTGNDGRYIDWTTKQVVYTVGSNAWPGLGFGANDQQLLLASGLYDLNLHQLWKPTDWYASPYPAYSQFLDSAMYERASNRIIASTWYHHDMSSQMQLQIHIYNYPDTQAIIKLASPLNSWIYQMKVSLDGSLLLASSYDGHNYTWDLSTGNLIRDTRMRSQIGNTYLQTSNDGKWIASGFLAGEILLWDATTGEEKQRWSMAVPYACFSECNPIKALRFSKDGKYLAAANWNGQAKVFNTETGAIEQTFALASGSADPIKDVDFTPANKLLVISGTSLSIIDFQHSGFKAIPLGGQQVRALDENRVLIKQKTAMIEYDCATGQTIKQFGFPTPNYFIMDLAADPTHIIGTYGTTCYAFDWNVPSYRTLFDENGTYEIPDIKLAPDGNTFLINNIDYKTGTNQTAIQLYSINTGKPLRYYATPGSASRCCAFSADGQRVFGATYGKVYAFTTLRPNASEAWALYQ